MGPATIISLACHGLGPARPAVPLAAALWRRNAGVRSHRTSKTQPPTPPESSGFSSTLLMTPEEDAMINVSYDRDESGFATGVAVMTLNTPDNANAMTVETGRVFEKKIRVLRRMPNVRAMVLTGDGEIFSSGGDLDFILARTNDFVAQNQVTMRCFYDKFMALRRVPFPVIAAINGAAVGDGACLALACDIRMASTNSKIGFDFVNHGIPPGMGGTHFLPMLTNLQEATRLFLTSDFLEAYEAKALGLVLSVHQPDELKGEAIRLARRIAKRSPVAVRSIVQSMRLQGDMTGLGLSKSLDRDAEQQAIAFASGHAMEGIRAIRENREPTFSDLSADVVPKEGEGKGGQEP